MRGFTEGFPEGAGGGAAALRFSLSLYFYLHTNFDSFKSLFSAICAADGRTSLSLNPGAARDSRRCPLAAVTSAGEKLSSGGRARLIARNPVGDAALQPLERSSGVFRGR